ncbi:MAG: DUF1571 domain-containing protein [Pirellulales bacterium]|nr:DUF1571 domain-containing protein [Pirellulales bacterium]
MGFVFASRLRRTWAALLATMAFVATARAEDAVSEPVYREAKQSAAAATTPGSPAMQPAAAPAIAPAVAAAHGAQVPLDVSKVQFDLAQKSGEHPLAPVLRTLKLSQEVIDHNVRDYSCNLVKQERVDGELLEQQKIFMKVMHEPFSVYMSFLTPYAGREVLFVDGQNSGKMVVLEAGFKRMLGKMNIDPQGSLAMSGQRHCITSVGIRNLTVKLNKMWETETKFGECEVKCEPVIKVAGREATMIQVVHPVPRQDFKFHACRLFLDNEYKVPIHFDAYSWAEEEGGDPELEESYTYANLKLNNGFTAREFDATNPELFKK